MADIVTYDNAGTPHVLSWLPDATPSDLYWTTGWRNGQPGGCQEAGFSLEINPNSTPPMLGIGRRVEVWDGSARPFVGYISEIERGHPWKIVAKGLGYRGTDFLCFDGSGNPSSVPDTAIDQAISRGLPWTRPTSVSATAYSGSGSTVDLNRINALVDAYATSVGKGWAVWGDGVLTLADDPTAVDWLYFPTDAVMGVADDEYATDIYARYVLTLSGTPPIPSAWGTSHQGDVTTADQVLRREYPYDLTQLGVMTGGRADTLASAALTSALSRRGWTSGFTVTPDDLLTPGGAPARMEDVRAGQRVRIMSVCDPVGNVIPGATVEVVIGETHYDDGAGQAGVVPVGLAARSFTDVLAAPQAPPDSFSDAS